MKKNFKIILFTVMMFPIFLKAAEVSLDCPSSTKNGSEITCKININSSETVAGFQANISTSSGLVYKSYTKTSGWAGTSSNTKFLIYDNAVTGKKTLGTYTYKVNTTSKENLTVTLSGISVSNENGVKITSNQTASDTIRIMNSDNTLKDLMINGITITGFNKDTLNYAYETQASSIKIGATKNDSYATISGTGTKTVKYGTNTYNIVVTSEDGNKRTYKITVTRPDKRDTTNTLNSLEIVGYKISPTFNQNTKLYKLNVESNVKELNIKAVKTSDKSSFVSEYGPRKVNLDYGKNIIDIKVKSENEKINTYTVEVNREDNRDSNNYLKTLQVSSGYMKFNKETTTYTLLTDEDEITISSTPESSKSTITGNQTYKLKNGINEIKIVVTSENEQTKTYILKVTKTEDISLLNISNSLKELNIAKKYILNFDKNTLEYNIQIDEEESLQLDYITEDENSMVEIVGNEKLKDGSIVILKVTSIDGKTKEYKINVTKKDENKDNDIITYIILSISIILNIILMLIILKNKKSE